MNFLPRNSLLVAFCVFTAVIAYSQHNGIEKEGDFINNPSSQAKRNVLHLRWYPLGLINTADLNLTFGVEYKYAPKKSLALDAGYIMASLYGSSTGDLEPATGWITRVNHRWYLSDLRDPFFLEAEAAFKKARYEGEDQWVGRGVVAGVPAYEQLMQVTSKKEVFTLGAKFGQHVRFSPEGRLGFEWTAGLGIRYRHYYPDLPDDAQVTSFDSWGINPWDYGEEWIPDLQVNLRLTWQIR